MSGKSFTGEGRLTAPRKLTDVFVRGFKNTEGKRLEVRDTHVTGLILRITPKNMKTFTLLTRGPDGKPFRKSIGRYPALSVKDAREIALGHLAKLARGEDLREAERRTRAKAEADSVTLEALLDEAEPVLSSTRAMWRRNYRRGRTKAEARAAIENVFAALLKTPLSMLTAETYAKAILNYQPKQPKHGKTTANGSASRALAYLRPVFDWACGRGAFYKIGAGRSPRLNLPDLSEIHDPSIGDNSLEVKRDRVLTQRELVAVVPLLVYPAPIGLRKNLDPADDYAPIAMRFLLLTLSRVEEIEAARRKDFDLRAGTWTKLVKTRKKKGAPGPTERRRVTVPLSDDAISILRSLPSFMTGAPDDLVFPTSQGGKQGNWHRTQEAIHKASSTSGWHRHDLRRTAATILRQLGVAPVVIDTLLCHVNPLSSEKVSDSAESYILGTKILQVDVDYERVAVNQLADAMKYICGMKSVPKAKTKTASRAELSHDKPRSPWATRA